MDSKLMTGVLRRRQMQRHREESHVKREAGIGEGNEAATAKECQGRLATGHG